MKASQSTLAGLFFVLNLGCKLQDNTLGADIAAKECGSILFEGTRMLRGVETGDSSACCTMVDVGMAFEIVAEAGRHILPLGNQLDMLWGITANLVVEQGIVGTTKDNGVDVGVVLEQLIDVFLHKVVGTLGLEFHIFDDRHPHGTGLSRYLDVWV